MLDHFTCQSRCLFPHKRAVPGQNELQCEPHFMPEVTGLDTQDYTTADRKFLRSSRHLTCFPRPGGETAFLDGMHVCVCVCKEGWQVDNCACQDAHSVMGAHSKSHTLLRFHDSIYISSNRLLNGGNWSLSKLRRSGLWPGCEHTHKRTNTHINKLFCLFTLSYWGSQSLKLCIVIK